MNTFQEWLHDELCKLPMGSRVAHDDVIEGLEGELAVVRRWKQEHEEEAWAELDDE